MSKRDSDRWFCKQIQVTKYVGASVTQVLDKIARFIPLFII